MSVHKNFVEGYGRDWDELCNSEVLPYQNRIFKLFSEKFYIDAERDGERGRKLLKLRGNNCSKLCDEIHSTLGGHNVIDEDENLKDLVNNIVNLDYNSLLEVFQTLKNKYFEIGEQGVTNQISMICVYLEKMWRISESRTTIKKEK